MVGNGNPGTLGLGGPYAFAQTIFQIWQQPDFRMSR